MNKNPEGGILNLHNIKPWLFLFFFLITRQVGFCDVFLACLITEI